jgi:hypothetical protein
LSQVIPRGQKKPCSAMHVHSHVLASHLRDLAMKFAEHIDDKKFSPCSDSRIFPTET